MKFLVTNPEGADFGTVESKGNSLKGAMMEFKAAFIKHFPYCKHYVYFKGDTLYVPNHKLVFQLKAKEV